MSDRCVEGRVREMKRRGYVLLEVILAMGIFLLCITYVARAMTVHMRVEEEFKKEAETRDKIRATILAKQAGEGCFLSKEEAVIRLGDYEITADKNTLIYEEDGREGGRYVFLERRGED
ncbi:MAG: hypothetical protein Q3993_00760 [Filifactor alocis]|nr:hypothetical protein [Filifactor alocis]